MRRLIWALLLTVVAVPAYAGHGTIEETDDGFIVEYTGDPSDKVPEKPNSGNNNKTAAAAPAQVEAPVPARGYQTAPATSQSADQGDVEKRRPRRSRYRSAARGQGSENAE